MSKRADDRIEIVTTSPAATMGLGARIGAALRGGEIFSLVGPLGSGKTHLIKGIGHGVGLGDDDIVNSPTFVLVNEYFADDKGLELYHIDAYRLKSVGEFEMLGFDDFCHDHSVVLIEWADKVRDALEGLDVVYLELSHIDEETRGITIKNAPSHIIAILDT